MARVATKTWLADQAPTALHRARQLALQWLEYEPQEPPSDVVYNALRYPLY